MTSAIDDKKYLALTRDFTFGLLEPNLVVLGLSLEINYV